MCSLAALALSCGSTTEADDGQAVASNTVGSSSSGGSGGGVAVGAPDSGEIQSPALPIEGDDSVVVLGSTLGSNAKGQIRWTFTFRNEATEPLCPFSLNAELLDAGGAMLAGYSVFSDEYAAGELAFTGIVLGSVYSGRRADGVVFLDTCIPPQGRGLAVADVHGFQESEPELVDAVLAAAATLRHDLTPGPANLEDLQRAPDLPRLDDLQLVDGPEGTVVQGVALSSADLYGWYAWFALYDANGMILDVVRAPASSIATLKDTPVQFSSDPTLAAPARLEAFFESSSLMH